MPRRKKATESAAFRKKIRTSAIEAAVDRLINKGKDNKNGRVPQGLMRQILLDLDKAGIQTNRDHLLYEKAKRQKRMKEMEERPPLSEIECNTNLGYVSTYNDSNGSTCIESEKKRGRPAGTTIVSAAEREKARVKCIDDITVTYAKEKVEKTERVAHNYLKALIESKWEEYQLYPEQYVSIQTIRTRYKRGNLEVAHRGTKPILPKTIEKVIVDIVTTMARIRHPLCVTQVIALANSIISDSKYKEELIEWKQKMYRNLPVSSNKDLGYGWWRGFSKRYEDVLVTKRGERFASDRADWSTETKLRQMYDAIYQNLCDARVARRLDEAVFQNMNGETVDNPEEKYLFDIDSNAPEQPLGLPCEHEIVNPDYLLFFDETGCNTNQKKDGHNGGEKYVCGRGMRPKQIASNRDRHFTVLGLTAASGDPVLCVVIFASERKGVAASWAEGIDLTVDPVKDEDGAVLLEKVNFGEGKYFPSGPTCFFRGKEIPYLPLTSPSGGITGELLVSILSWLDEREIFERFDGGPEPFIVVDGHESRLQPVFVDYITDPKHIWHVNFGIPHATSYWQVGDSPEQNGHFKMLLGNAKKDLVNFKIQHNIPLHLTAKDIVPLINKAWYPSFANKTTNRKAIAARGWNPLNRNLLLHPEIKVGSGNSTYRGETEDSTSEENDEVANTVPLLLNCTEGISGMCFQKMLQHYMRNGGIDQNQENLRRGESIQETFLKAKRMSSSVMIRRGVHEINDSDVVALIKGNRDRMKEIELRSARKKRNELRSRIELVNQLRLTKPMEEWNMKDCKDYIQYKKQKGDPKMPNTLPLLKARCFDFQSRASPDCSMHESDDEQYQINFDGIGEEEENIGDRAEI
jgi:hypothetical protein